MSSTEEEYEVDLSLWSVVDEAGNTSGSVDVALRIYVEHYASKHGVVLDDDRAAIHLVELMIASKDALDVIVTPKVTPTPLPGIKTEVVRNPTSPHLNTVVYDPTTETVTAYIPEGVSELSFDLTMIHGMYEANGTTQWPISSVASFQNEDGESTIEPFNERTCQFYIPSRSQVETRNAESPVDFDWDRTFNNASCTNSEILIRAQRDEILNAPLPNCVSVTGQFRCDQFVPTASHLLKTIAVGDVSYQVETLLQGCHSRTWRIIKDAPNGDIEVIVEYKSAMNGVSTPENIKQWLATQIEILTTAAEDFQVTDVSDEYFGTPPVNQNTPVGFFATVLTKKA